MLKRLRSFFGEYRSLGIVTITIIASLILDLSGYDTSAHWLLGLVSLGIIVPVTWEMIETIRSGRYGIDLLAITAIVTSVILHEYWAGVIIALMLTGGEALEDHAEKRAKSELTDLLERKPKRARLLKGTRMMDVTVHSIMKGDKLVIYPGEIVPVDAVIIEGASNFDESSLTGESIPVSKQINDEILSGSINIDGAITVKALHAAADSQYERIIKLVKSASASQSPFVRLADRFSLPFTFVAFLIAGAAWLISGEPIRFLEVIVVATPCPLLLAAPIALISGMSRAAKYGVIVKTGSALERLAEVETVAFDKTGTLTVGVPSVGTVDTYNKFSSQSVLLYAAALEQSSNHVLAKAIIEAADKGSDKKLAKAKLVKEIAGNGLQGRLNGKTVLVGRLSMLQDQGVSFPKNFKETYLKQTATLVAVDGELAGIITFRDAIRPNAKSMLRRIKKAGIENVVMVTGDNTAAAVAVAKELNIVDVYPDCLPADKLAVIDQLPNRPVAFVGDGINDAPVLTAADVGIALGARGSTAASETADVVILLDNVSRVADGIEIAKRTFGIARQSILLGIILSLGLMGVFATGAFKPIYGAAVQEVVDVAVIFNALRAHGSGKRSKSR